MGLSILSRTGLPNYWVLVHEASGSIYYFLYLQASACHSLASDSDSEWEPWNSMRNWAVWATEEPGTGLSAVTDKKPGTSNSPITKTKWSSASLLAEMKASSAVQDFDQCSLGEQTQTETLNQHWTLVGTSCLLAQSRVLKRMVHTTYATCSVLSRVLIPGGLTPPSQVSTWAVYPRSDRTSLCSTPPVVSALPELDTHPHCAGSIFTDEQVAYRRHFVCFTTEPGSADLYTERFEACLALWRPKQSCFNNEKNISIVVCSESNTCVTFCECVTLTQGYFDFLALKWLP